MAVHVHWPHPETWKTKIGLDLAKRPSPKWRSAEKVLVTDHVPVHIVGPHTQVLLSAPLGQLLQGGTDTADSLPSQPMAR